MGLIFMQNMAKAGAVEPYSSIWIPNFIVLGVAAKTAAADSNNMPYVHDFSDKFNMGYICSLKNDDCLIQSI